MKKTCALSISLLLVFNLASCGQHAVFSRNSSFENSPLSPNSVDPTDVFHPIQLNGLVKDTWKQLTNSEITKLDVVLSMDASESMEQEIANVQAALDDFVSTMVEQNIDLCMGVITGDPQEDGIGLLEPLHFKTRAPVRKLACTENMSKETFVQTMKKSLSVKLEGSSGETGLYAFKESFLNPEKLKTNQKAGFFRDDAALAVMFVSDENDASTSGMPQIKKCAIPKTTVFLPAPKSNFEECSEAYARQAYYSKKVEGKENTYELVWSEERIYNELKAFQGALPFYAGFIGYTGLPGFVESDINQIGHGFIEFVTRAKGDLIDLTQVQDTTKFIEAFKKFARNAALISKKQMVFDLSRDVCPGSGRLFVSGIEVKDYVLNGRRLEITNPEFAGLPGASVEYHYKDAAKGCD